MISAGPFLPQRFPFSNPQKGTTPQQPFRCAHPKPKPPGFSGWKWIPILCWECWSFGCDQNQQNGGNRCTLRICCNKVVIKQQVDDTSCHIEFEQKHCVLCVNASVHVLRYQPLKHIYHRSTNTFCFFLDFNLSKPPPSITGIRPVFCLWHFFHLF